MVRYGAMERLAFVKLQHMAAAGAESRWRVQWIYIVYTDAVVFPVVFTCNDRYS